jgi:hypothetical protein
MLAYHVYTTNSEHPIIFAANRHHLNPDGRLTFLDENKNTVALFEAGMWVGFFSHEITELDMEDEEFLPPVVGEAHGH